MKKLLILTLVLLIVLPFAGCAKKSGSDVIVFGTSADYPPFEFHILDDNGKDKVVGLDVALAYQIAEDMGKELVITEMNFDNLLALMDKGDCDFVIAAMEKSDERLESSSASDPYYTDLPAMILVKKENLAQYTSLESFSGKRVGAQTGTTKADIIRDDMPGAQADLMQSVIDLVNNLVYNKCDALVLDGAVAMQYAQSDDSLAIVEAGQLGDAFPYCVWVAKDDPKGLLDSINKTIAKVLEDGSMDVFIDEADELSSRALDS